MADHCEGQGVPTKMGSGKAATPKSTPRKGKTTSARVKSAATKSDTAGDTDYLSTLLKCPEREAKTAAYCGYPDVADFRFFLALFWFIEH